MMKEIAMRKERKRGEGKKGSRIYIDDDFA